MIFGQDEAICNQDSSSSMKWVGPNGKHSLFPKNNGMGKMISAFQSRETKWWIELSNVQLLEVYRLKEGQHCFDQEAAKDVNDTKEKSPLNKSLFICTFMFGCTNCNWTGSHTIIQTRTTLIV